MAQSKINIINILRIKKHRYFNESLNNHTRLNKIIYYSIVKLMIHAMMNNSLETLLIIDEKFKSKIYTSNDINNVNIPDNILNIMNRGVNAKYIMMHNHPDNSNFSIKDLNTFIARCNIVYLVIVTNDCKHIAILGMNENVNDELRKRMISTIEKYCVKNKLDEHASATKLIEFFQSKGLLYTVYKNY